MYTNVKGEEVKGEEIMAEDYDVKERENETEGEDDEKR